MVLFAYRLEFILEGARIVAFRTPWAAMVVCYHTRYQHRWHFGNNLSLRGMQAEGRGTV
jgi:hypothetical protein